VDHCFNGVVSGTFGHPPILFKYNDRRYSVSASTLTGPERNHGTISGIPEYGDDEPDYYEFIGIRWCELCGRQTCICPKYISSQRGTVLWMHEDMGAMMIVIDDDTQPWEMIGRCYHEIDPDNGADYVYQLMDHMTGPPHNCIFRVKRVGDRYTLPDENGRMRRMGWKPRIIN